MHVSIWLKYARAFVSGLILSLLAANSLAGDLLSNDFLEVETQLKLMKSVREYPDKSSLFDINPKINRLVAQTEDLDIDFGDYGEGDAEQFEEQYEEDIDALEESVESAPVITEEVPQQPDIDSTGTIEETHLKRS